MPRSHFAIPFFILSFSAWADISASTISDFDAQIKQACSAEILTARCGEKSFEKGLLKCLHDHRRRHKKFKSSSECQAVKNNIRKIYRESSPKLDL